jgi:Flp pilus assembly protein TadG
MRSAAMFFGMKFSLPSSAASFLRRFVKDDSGVSAMEFALLLPFMLTLYLGGMQLSQGIDIDRKVTLAARTVADLTSQVASIDKAGVTTVLNAATQVLSPYADSNADASKLVVRVSLIKVDAQSKVTIEWSEAKNGPELTEVTVPDALKVANTYLVLGEASYAYTPPVGYVLTGTMSLSDKIYMRPRLSASVDCPSCK